MIGFRDPEPKCSDKVIKSCMDCPFCVDEYIGGDYQFRCHAPGTKVIRPIPEPEDRSNEVADGCPLKNNHIRIILDGFPPEEDYV